MPVALRTDFDAVACRRLKPVDLALVADVHALRADVQEYDADEQGRERGAAEPEAHEAREHQARAIEWHVLVIHRRMLRPEQEEHYAQQPRPHEPAR